MKDELAPLGFAWDRKRVAEYRPPCWSRVKKNAGSRPTREYQRKYDKAQREKWLRMGIVKPQNDAERAIAAGGQQ